MADQAEAEFPLRFVCRKFGPMQVKTKRKAARSKPEDNPTQETAFLCHYPHCTYPLLIPLPLPVWRTYEVPYEAKTPAFAARPVLH